MNWKIKINTAFIIGVIWLLGGVFFAIQSFYVEEYFAQYMLNLGTYFLIGILLIGRNMRCRISLFEPLTIISMLYIFMFGVVPMLDIINDEVTMFGVSTMSGGTWGMVVFLAGYVAFFIGYNWKFKPILENVEIDDGIVDVSKTNRGLVIAWLFCFAAGVVYIMLSGKSLLYIFSGGFFGSGAEGDVETNLLFLSVFSKSLITLWLLYQCYGRSKILKVICFLLTADIYWIQGFRYILIIMGFAWLAVHFIRKRANVKPMVLLAFICISVGIVGLMGSMRDALRDGDGVQVENDDSAVEMVRENFGIYKTYYAVIRAVPSIVPYNYLDQIGVQAVTMLVPRAIWPGKPEATVNEPVIYGMSKYAAKAGQAYPNVGELYYAGGIVAVIIGMFLYGYLNKKLICLCKGKIFTGRLVLYAVLMAINFQLVIRGYMPSNLWLIIMMTVPILLVRKKKAKGLEATVQYVEEE